MKARRLSGSAPPILALAVMAAPSIAAESPPPQVDEAFREFAENVRRYVELAHRVEAGLPPLPDRAEALEIARHQQALSSGIRFARKGAKRGDIFSDDAEDAIVDIVRSAFEGPDGEHVLAAIKEGNPAWDRESDLRRIKLFVNAPYPAGASFSTVPPSLLQRFPPLPEELQYRFVGLYLVLIDTNANLVVDYIKKAIPKKAIPD